MNLDQIRELLQIVADSGVAEVEIEEGDFKLVARRQAPQVTVATGAAPMPAAYPPVAPYPAPYPLPPNYTAPAPAPAPPAAAPVAAASAPAPAAPAPEAAEEGDALAANETIIRAPIVGTFYRAPAPDADLFVNPGDTVKEGDVLCIIEAMKLMNEIESELSGTIVKILVENATPVEYDQPLFVVAT